MSIPRLPRRKQIAYWLLGGCAMVFAIMIIGGITRLTQSGLSITEWEPIRGILPPLSEGDWTRYFEAYRSSPEYQALNQGMSLSEFRQIFWWEYIHRVVARVFGLGLVLPMIYFAIKGWLRGQTLVRATALVVLVGLQALLGWAMVQTGLGDRPYVSHHHLAGHLALALILFGFMFWWALELLRQSSLSKQPSPPGSSLLRGGALVFSVGVFLQCIWGAFVAGLGAGRMVNTFPKMGEHWVSPFLGQMTPFIVDLTTNPLTVQFVHRTLGILLAVFAVALLVTSHNFSNSPVIKKAGWLLFAITVVQVTLGIFTLLLAVPVALGVLHQGVGLLLFGAALWLLHLCWRP